MNFSRGIDRQIIILCQIAYRLDMVSMIMGYQYGIDLIKRQSIRPEILLYVTNPYTSIYQYSKIICKKEIAISQKKLSKEKKSLSS